MHHVFNGYHAYINDMNKKYHYIYIYIIITKINIIKIFSQDEKNENFSQVSRC